MNENHGHWLEVQCQPTSSVETLVFLGQGDSDSPRQSLFFDCIWKMNLPNLVCHTGIYDVIPLQENGSKLFSASHRQLLSISVVFFFLGILSVPPDPDLGLKMRP